MLAMSATTDVSFFYCTEGMTRLRGEGENFPGFFLVFRRFLLHRRVARIFNNKLRRFLQLHIGRFSNVYRINSYRKKEANGKIFYGLGPAKLTISAATASLPCQEWPKQKIVPVEVKNCQKLLLSK